MRDCLIAWLAGLLCLSTALAHAGPQVKTSLGLAEGSLDGEVAVFKGLPYAAPPVGALRWRAPQPAPPWVGTRDATRFGLACAQKAGMSLENGGDVGPQGEDCLVLNVWSAQIQTQAQAQAPPQRAALRPVLVWLHGGAYLFGAGSLPLYDGAALARRGLVVVTLNYRLGALGFFAHPAIAREGKSLNFGLLDQIAALRWVRQNIEAFGGDPTQVTLAGQSAGAQSVLALMASPQARGLFQRAVAQSPYGLPSHSLAKASETAIRQADKLGLPGARASAAALRAVPAEELAALVDPGLSLAPSPIVGDAVLPTPLLRAFQQGRQAKVPLLIGSNSDEATVVQAFGVDPAQVIKRLGAAKLLVQGLYPGVKDPSELGRQLSRDAAFTAFARRIAVLQSAAAPTWRYYYAHVPEAARSEQAGVGHGGEIPAVFGTSSRRQCLAAAPTPADKALFAQVQARWAAFALGGAPDLAGQATWPRDGRLNSTAMVFDDSGQPTPGFMRQRLNALILTAGVLAP
jgi:para-nitrobenzyl esterase